MSVYLDASVLISLFVRDEMSELAQSTLRAHLEPVMVSDWTLAESVSILARAVRTKVLAGEAAQRAMAAIDSWVSRAAKRVEVLPGDIRDSEIIPRGLDTTLRAPDALHIVIARRLDLALLSFDVAMNRDATNLGVRVAP